MVRSLPISVVVSAAYTARRVRLDPGILGHELGADGHVQLLAVRRSKRADGYYTDSVSIRGDERL